MAPPAAPNADDWDPDRLRLPPELVGDLAPRKRAPRHRVGEAFLRGPIPFAWIAAACRLPGSGFHVAMAVRFLRGRFPRQRGWGLGEIAIGLGLSEQSARRGLNAAELVGLVAVEREPGCKLAVAILDAREPKTGPTRPPLYGPIPWRWWHAASRLPGKALQVAMACWLVAGWERSGEFQFGLSEWADLGLLRFSAGRGLRELEAAGLVEVAESAGRKPVVTIREAPPPSPDPPRGRRAVAASS